MKGILTAILLFIVCSYCSSQTIYLLPGQGSDSTLFSKLTFPEKYEVKQIKYITPYEDETMQAYAKRLSTQIADYEFILIGVSLGGMLSTELTELVNPLKTIIISSAKSQYELPKRYHFQKKIPLYKLFGPRINKIGAKVLQPLVEPDRNKEKEAFKAMLDRKDPIFLNRTIAMIINWDRTKHNPDIIHIHGDNDHTLPHRNIEFDYLVSDGSHMMTLTRAEEISKILCKVLD